jgi:hypothetical protein
LIALKACLPFKIAINIFLLNRNILIRDHFDIINVRYSNVVEYYLSVSIGDLGGKWCCLNFAELSKFNLETFRSSNEGATLVLSLDRKLEGESFQAES